MAETQDNELIYDKIRQFARSLEEHKLKVWRLYLYGSYVKGGFGADSDIDLAVFLDKDDLDGFDEDALMMKLRRKVDIRIEPHPFARTDFDEADPYIKEIIKTGRRII